MERSLLWVALTLGVIGGLCGLLPPRRGGASPPLRETVAPLFLYLAVLLPLIVFLLTLPAQPPFSPGQGWGRGFLLGGIGALLTAWLLVRGAANPAAVAVPFSLPLVVVAASLLLLRASAVDALLGVAMAWLAVALLLYLGRTSETPGGLPLLASTGFTVTLCAAAALGVYRDPLTPQMARGTWSAAALALASGIPLSLLLGALLPANLRARLPLRLLIAAALLALLGWLLAGRVVNAPRLLPVVAVGLLLGPALWWLARDALLRGGPASPAGLPPLAVLLVASGFMVAFQMLQGFGVAALLLAAWLSAGVFTTSAPEKALPERDAARGLLCLLLFGTVLVLYRLFASRWDDALRGVTLTDHYAFFGFIVGVALPGWMAGLLAPPAPNRAGPLPPAPSPAKPLRGGEGEKTGRGEAGERIAAGSPFPVSAANEVGKGVGGLGLLLLAPGVIVLLWGAKCVLALLAGLAVGSVLGFGGRAEDAPGRSLLPGLLAIAMALVLTQWLGHALPFAEMTRAEKVRVLAVLVGAAAALLLLVDYGGRRRGGTAAAPAPEGVAS